MELKYTTVIWPAHMQLVRYWTRLRKIGIYIRNITMQREKKLSPHITYQCNKEQFPWNSCQKACCYLHADLSSVRIWDSNKPDTLWPISFLGKRYSWAQLADLCGHAGHCCHISATWNVLASLQLSASPRSQVLFSVKKNELTMTFLFILCNCNVDIS